MGMQNEKCCSTEADIWAGGMTMMKVLVNANRLKPQRKLVDVSFTILLC